MTDEDPPPPKRRRKPPPGFDTGYPGDATETPSGGIPRKPIWSESKPATSESRPSETRQTAPTESRPIEARPTSIESRPTGSHETESRPTGPSAPFDPMPASAPFDPMPAADSAPFDPIPAGAPIPTESFAPITGAEPIPEPPLMIPAGPMSAGASGSMPAPMGLAPLSDAPILPAVADDLRDAVGAKRKKPKRAKTPVDDDVDDFEKPRSKRTIVVVIATLFFGFGIAGIVFLGYRNNASYYLTCESDRVVAEQGRSFPPWGESPLEGKQWAPIKIPPEAECSELETEDKEVLSTEFRSILKTRASLLLQSTELPKIDEANALLEQALLHTRSDKDSSRDARKEIKHLQGDVTYRRASLKMRDASKALLEAAKQFDATAQQVPHHAKAAFTWAEYLRKVVGQLDAGPDGIPAPSPSTPTRNGNEPRAPAPPGVALPIKPGNGSAEPPQPTPPDAGLPTGGVLL